MNNVETDLKNMPQKKMFIIRLEMKEYTFLCFTPNQIHKIVNHEKQMIIMYYYLEREKKHNFSILNSFHFDRR